ncbi:MAG: hypothetical protein LBM27_05135 [Lactobacillaceae bacterium]|nr:hypothetical protein [Lactobacillaceae bacterium]
MTAKPPATVEWE